MFSVAGMVFILEYANFHPFREGVKLLEKLSYKLGSCVVCGQRIYSDQNFVKSAEGYCCEDCITEEDVVTA